MTDIIVTAGNVTTQVKGVKAAQERLKSVEFTLKAIAHVIAGANGFGDNGWEALLDTQQAAFEGIKAILG